MSFTWAICDAGAAFPPRSPPGFEVASSATDNTRSSGLKERGPELSLRPGRTRLPAWAARLCPTTSRSGATGRSTPTPWRTMAGPRRRRSSPPVLTGTSRHCGRDTSYPGTRRVGPESGPGERASQHRFVAPQGVSITSPSAPKGTRVPDVRGGCGAGPRLLAPAFSGPS